MPVFLFCHNAMVQPERMDGAYAVEGRFRFSHFSIGILNADDEEDFSSSTVGVLILLSKG
jgi:hypothetical protein